MKRPISMLNIKNLRSWCISGDEELPTDNELQYLLDHYDFDLDVAEEYSGNFILTKCIHIYEEQLDHLCCGILTKTFMVNGEVIYYAMDYGH